MHAASQRLAAGSGTPSPSATSLIGHSYAVRVYAGKMSLSENTGSYFGQPTLPRLQNSDFRCADDDGVTAAVRLLVPRELQLHPTSRGSFKKFGLTSHPPRSTNGRVFATGTEAAHRNHSGNPAFRRPSVISFAFDCPPRAIHEDIVNAGSVSSRRAAASRASTSRPR